MRSRRGHPRQSEAAHKARLRSERIDSELASEAAYLARRRPSEVTLLLLGQSESGKSTLQKQFQLLYAPTSLETERLAWRGIMSLHQRHQHCPANFRGVESRKRRCWRPSISTMTMITAQSNLSVWILIYLTSSVVSSHSYPWKPSLQSA
ncbi:hypothetical protein BS47DRAFT_185527 [Hydnum rufescens UP504]|uniref:Uncharacterized protein n=1 Tax=Hydnum rufescens UP504 TaxID=1448309 RepID=A0A9P6AQE7_9AGAM|nr:hypothetical protein BS47DRAFT_185527 [Hydnum rufescens UP504]